MCADDNELKFVAHVLDHCQHPLHSLFVVFFPSFDGLIVCSLPSLEIDFSGQSTFNPLP